MILQCDARMWESESTLPNSNYRNQGIFPTRFSIRNIHPAYIIITICRIKLLFNSKCLSVHQLYLGSIFSASIKEREL